MGYSCRWTRISNRRNTGVSASAIKGAATTAIAAHTTRACHSHSHICRVNASGSVRTACKNTRGDSGIAWVWNTRDPSLIKGIANASSTGNIAWFAICDATRFSRN